MRLRHARPYSCAVRATAVWSRTTAIGLCRCRCCACMYHKTVSRATNRSYSAWYALGNGSEEAATFGAQRDATSLHGCDCVSAVAGAPVKVHAPSAGSPRSADPPTLGDDPAPPCRSSHSLRRDGDCAAGCSASGAGALGSAVVSADAPTDAAWRIASRWSSSGLAGTGSVTALDSSFVARTASSWRSFDGDALAAHRARLRPPSDALTMAAGARWPARGNGGVRAARSAEAAPSTRGTVSTQARSGRWPRSGWPGVVGAGFLSESPPDRSGPVGFRTGM